MDFEDSLSKGEREREYLINFNGELNYRTIVLKLLSQVSSRENSVFHEYYILLLYWEGKGRASQLIYHFDGKVCDLNESFDLLSREFCAQSCRPLTKQRE